MVAPAYVHEGPIPERSNRPFGRDSLLLKAELLDKRVVATLIALLEIAKMSTSISNHLEKTAARVKILLILLEVRRQFVNFTGQNGDLDRNGAGVSVVDGRILDDGRLYPFRKHYRESTTP